jgi:hypothetical protein
VLAALPSGAKHALRLTCRAGRNAVDAQTRRLDVKQALTLLRPPAVARMPLLVDLDLFAADDASVAALAATLPALARLRRATLWARGSGSAADGLLSSLAGLTALTRLHLSIDLQGASRAARPRPSRHSVAHNPLHRGRGPGGVPAEREPLPRLPSRAPGRPGAPG